MKPREWWDSLPASVVISVEDAKERGYYCMDMRLYYRDKYSKYAVVPELLEHEEALGLDRNDWIYLHEHLVFTHEDQALMFKLVMEI